MSRIFVVGDVLLDRDIIGAVERLAPDAPVPVIEESHAVVRPGGAGLAAALAARDGHEVTLITALGDDAAAQELRALLEKNGVVVVDLGCEIGTPEKVRFFAGDRPLLRLDRGGAPLAAAARSPLSEDTLRGLMRGAEAILVSDYGYGVTGRPVLRSLLTSMAVSRTPLVWDPHPRGSPPVSGVRLVTPNRAEALLFAGASAKTADDDVALAPRWCRTLLERWRARGVVVKLGVKGAVVVDGEAPAFVVPATAVLHGDPCGAGDRFAASAAAALAEGASLRAAVEEAVRVASSFVATGGARRAFSPQEARPLVIAPGSGIEQVEALIREVRARNGRVVATGGCFDVLHAGHVRMLAAARALGDCLIVCVNSDESVRRLKGEGRPVHKIEDRRAVLTALSCVDAVVVFDEDTPEQILERLRPDLWVKAADYLERELPEAAVVAAGGGEPVIVPYLPGRSTTRILKEVKGHGGT